MQTALLQRRPRHLGALVATALITATAIASAQEKTAAGTNAPPPPIPWETTAAAGLTMTRGNSKTVLTTLSLDTKRKWDHNEAAFGAAGGYGENDNEKNTEFFNAFGQYNRLFSERFYAGLRTDFNYDGIANLSYRVTVSPLVGYYFVKTTNTSLTLEAGPSAVFEKYVGKAENTYLGARLAERFQHKLSATTKIWESVEYVPKVEDWAEKYVITGEAGIDAAITKKWSLRVVFQDIFDSQPASGRLQNDMRLIAGTAYKF